MSRIYLFLKLPLEFLAELICISQLWRSALLANQRDFLLCGAPAVPKSTGFHASRHAVLRFTCASDCMNGVPVLQSTANLMAHSTEWVYMQET